MLSCYGKPQPGQGFQTMNPTQKMLLESAPWKSRRADVFSIQALSRHQRIFVASCLRIGENQIKGPNLLLTTASLFLRQLEEMEPVQHKVNIQQDRPIYN